ncbi:hypothetical protein EJB05_26142 [Eragrostis curvula]|uniref:Uncharacterized protein n=1 Tax=Eragrostis curvula TaxID=38414 RepID=A0A5J9UJ61_9POAL|nr:hypothetical protein EJB05_26142 [Eragrostis curvula]
MDVSSTMPPSKGSWSSYKLSEQTLACWRGLIDFNLSLENATNGSDRRCNYQRWQPIQTIPDQKKRRDTSINNQKLLVNGLLDQFYLSIQEVSDGRDRVTKVSVFFSKRTSAIAEDSSSCRWIWASSRATKKQQNRVRRAEVRERR